MFKKGDKVRVRPGVIYAGQVGRVEKKLEHSNEHGSWETFLVQFDDQTARYTPDVLEKVPRWRSIDEE